MTGAHGPADSPPGSRSDRATEGLADRLVGAWSLYRYVVTDSHGTVIDQPFGEEPAGTLVYTPTGLVSVHAMAGGRPRCGTRRPVECAAATKVAAYDSYFGYAGTYTVHGELVTHRVEVGSFPDWTGTALQRVVSFVDGRLVLTGAGPHRPGARVPVLTWSEIPGGASCTRP